MDISKISVPNVYKEESADFRFFLKWFELCLSKIQRDHEGFFDLLDPLRCPSNLLWMLADTMGFKYDERFTVAFNRLVLVYFMSMIRLKGSKDGVTLAAQVNLGQFNIDNYVKENSALSNRLEDTTIPVNAVYVNPNLEQGYIDLVYYSDSIPVDACIEYVRPVGMYLVPHAGVRYDSKTKITIDSRLTNVNDLNVSIGPTHVGHYSKDDYSRMQRLFKQDIYYSNDEAKNIVVKPYPDAVSSTIYIMKRKYNIRVDDQGNEYNTITHVRDIEGMSRESRDSGEDYIKPEDSRQYVYYRNTDYESDLPGHPNEKINPGYRSLYSLQLSNPENIVRSLLRNLSSDFDLNNDTVGVEGQDTKEDPSEVVVRTLGTMGTSMDT